MERRDQSHPDLDASLAIPSASSTSQAASPRTPGHEVGVQTSELVPDFRNWPMDNLSTIKPDFLYCMLPMDLTRYWRKHTFTQSRHPHVHIPPLGTQNGIYARQNPKGWRKYVHLEGWPFWYNQSREVGVLTDVNLLDDAILRRTNEFIDNIFEYIQEEELQLEKDIQLVVEAAWSDDKQDYCCGYYFVRHETRSIFWPEKAGVSNSVSSGSGYVSMSHFQLNMEMFYWWHWVYFANVQVVSEKMYDELMGMLIFDILEQQTDSLSNAYLFSLNELQSYVQSVETIRRLANGQSEGGPLIIGRLMYAYKRRQFSTFWGEYCPRTRRDQSAHCPGERPRTRFMKIMSLCLFGAPDAHLRRMEVIFIDDEVAIQPWRDFMAYLHAEWQDFILNSAVLLTANVAFLAIDSVNGKGNDPHYRSPSQIASYLSTLMSISSMLSGLLLVRQTRTKARDSVWEASAYLRPRFYRIVGFEPLAIVYSLPYGFLMWAVMFFMVAFLLVCLLGTTLITRLLCGMVGLIFEHKSWWNTSVDALQRWRARARSDEAHLV